MYLHISRHAGNENGGCHYTSNCTVLQRARYAPARLSYIHSVVEKLRNALNSRTNHAIYYIKQGIFELDTVANESTTLLTSFPNSSNSVPKHFHCTFPVGRTAGCVADPPQGTLKITEERGKTEQSAIYNQRRNTKREGVPFSINDNGSAAWEETDGLRAMPRAKGPLRLHRGWLSLQSVHRQRPNRLVHHA